MKRWAAFLLSEAGSAVALLAATLAALLIANSPWGPAVAHGLHFEVATKSLTHWINDGLMVVFFLVVGMEIKREVVAA
jgi:NhaA family Na+:H+ antiporter